MNVYLCKRSAYLLLAGMSDEAIASAPRSSKLEGCATSAPDVHETSLSMFGIEDMPLDLMVPDAALRPRKQGVRCHVWSSPLPEGSLLEIGEETYVTSPEATFLQMASELSLVSRIELGIELCGTYAFSPMEPGFVQRSCSISSTKKLRSYVAKSKGSYGVARAREALSWVADGSASPAETKAFMKTRLSRYRGGFGFPAPELNYRLGLSAKNAALIEKPYLVLDMFFPEKKVAIEYDSDRFHVGASRIASDARRRNLLEHMGIRVLTLTNDQLRSSRKFETFMKQLARALNVRFRVPDHQLALRDIDLYGEMGLPSWFSANNSDL